MLVPFVHKKISSIFPEESIGASCPPEHSFLESIYKNKIRLVISLSKLVVLVQPKHGTKKSKENFQLPKRGIGIPSPHQQICCNLQLDSAWKNVAPEFWFLKHMHKQRKFHVDELI